MDSVQPVCVGSVLPHLSSPNHSRENGSSPTLSIQTENIVNLIFSEHKNLNAACVSIIIGVLFLGH